jgi:hypothetical protein
VLDEQESRPSVEPGTRWVEPVDLRHRVHEFVRDLRQISVIAAPGESDLAVLTPVEVVHVLDAECGLGDEAGALGEFSDHVFAGAEPVRVENEGPIADGGDAERLLRA